MMKLIAKQRIIAFIIIMCFMIIPFKGIKIFAATDITPPEIYSDSQTIYYTDGNQHARDFALIVFNISYEYNKRTKNFDFTINVDCTNRLYDKPTIWLDVSVYESDEKMGIYELVDEVDFGRIGYLDNSTISIAAQTGHYKIYPHVYCDEQKWDLQIGNPFAYWCINRTGRIWNLNYVDQNSGIFMSEPCTSWEKETLYSRESNLNKKFKKWYDEEFSQDLNISIYEIHHMRPLAYGGDNSMENLIPLPPQWHKQVTGWFNGY